MNSLRPAPNAEAREAIGQEMVMVTSCEGNPCDSLLTVISYENPIRIHTSENYIGPLVILIASAGREISDFNELGSTLTKAGYSTIGIEAIGIKDCLLYTSPSPRDRG